MRSATESGKRFPYWIVFFIILLSSQGSSGRTRAEKDKDFLVGTWMESNKTTHYSKKKLLFIKSNGTCTIDDRLGAWSLDDNLLAIAFGTVKNRKNYFLEISNESFSDRRKNGQSFVKVSGP